VTDQTAGAPQSGPAAAAGGGTVIEAFPGELGAGSAIARAVAHVEIGVDGEKRKFTVVLATDGNVRRSAQVDLVPLGVGRADDPRARLYRRLPPTRVNTRSWIRRSSFTCISIRNSPTSSRNRMPLRARSTNP